MKHIHHPHEALKLNLDFITAVLNAKFIQTKGSTKKALSSVLFFIQTHAFTSSVAGSMIFNKRHMYSHSEMSESTGIETKH